VLMGGGGGPVPDVEGPVGGGRGGGGGLESWICGAEKFLLPPGIEHGAPGWESETLLTAPLGLVEFIEFEDVERRDWGAAASSLTATSSPPTAPLAGATAPLAGTTSLAAPTAPIAERPPGKTDDEEESTVEGSRGAGAVGGGLGGG